MKTISYDNVEGVLKMDLINHRHNASNIIAGWTLRLLSLKAHQVRPDLYKVCMYKKCNCYLTLINKITIKETLIRKCSTKRGISNMKYD